MEKMTSKERLLAALRRREVDHVPCAPAFWTGKPDYQSFTWKDQDAYLAYVLEELDADARLYVSVGSPLPPYESWTEEVASEDYPLLHSRLETPKGELRASIRRTEDYEEEDVPLFSDWTVSRYVKPWIETMEDAEKFASVYLPPTDAEAARARDDLAAAQRLSERWQVEIIGHSGFALNGAVHAMGAEQGVLLAMDHPEVVDVFMDAVYRNHSRALDVLLDLGVTTILRNGWYDSTDFWSPDQFARWVFPQLRADIEKVHGAGGIYIYQMCTGIGPMLPQLAQLPFDCLLEFEPALAMVRLEQVRDALPGKSFWGGVSAPVHLENGSAEAVRQAVRDAFEVLGTTGLILKAVPSIRAHLPKTNIDAFFDEWRKFR